MKRIPIFTNSQFLRLGLASLCLGLPLSGQIANAQNGIDFNEAERMMGFQAVELRDQLVFGLRCNLPEQTEFIDHVVARVEAGEVPRAMVNVVFVWAKKRNPKIPYPYFEVVLRLLAEKRGVTFPATNSLQAATAY